MTERPMLSRFKSHKEVRAAYVRAIEFAEDGSATIVLVDDYVVRDGPLLDGHVNPSPRVVQTAPGYRDKFKGGEDALGVYVVYEDGYESWSPVKAFNEGYIMVFDDPRPKSPEAERVDGYLATIARLEPDIHPIDASAFYASAAISLKRSADAQETGNQLTVVYMAASKGMEKDKHDEWLRRHGFADLAPDASKDVSYRCLQCSNTVTAQQHKDCATCEGRSQLYASR